MPTLAEQITSDGKRPAVVTDLASLVDTEVQRKGGLTGLGIKTAYGLVKAIKPSFVRDAIDGLLDECVGRLEPIYASCVAAGGPVGQRFSARAGEVADALLGVTDGRAQRTRHEVAKKAYLRLRPTAKRNVEEAVPRLGELIERHTRG
jgi:hypothetical protein